MQGVLDNCETESLGPNPDSFCEEHITFRDGPKCTDEATCDFASPILLEKLRQIQPRTLPDMQAGISPEATDVVSSLPRGTCTGTLLLPPGVAAKPPRPPAPPPAPPELCDDDGAVCGHLNDGECDDGGAGSVYSLCPYGKDCTDCGARVSSPPPLPPPPSSRPLSPRWVECGRRNRCGPQVAGWAIPDARHEVRCCSGTKLGAMWDKRAGCDVWAESDGPEMGGCHHGKTFEEAEAVCAGAGARLCTKDELASDCTRGTGCGHDRDLVWSSTELMPSSPKPAPPAPAPPPPLSLPPRPPPASPEAADVPSPLTSYRRHGGLNCQGGGGGMMIDAPNSPVATNVDAAGCAALCHGTEGCAATLHQSADYTWVPRLNKNCYNGAGATEVAIAMTGSSEVCLNMPLAECKTQCILVAECEGITWANSDSDDHGLCCLRKDITRRECDSGGGEWDTHELTRRPVGTRGGCWRMSGVTLSQCDAQNEGFDTYVRDERPAQPWWQTTHFAERVVMPRHYKCAASATCTLPELQNVVLPQLEAAGYSVVNIDWPVHASPDALFMGFGIHSPYDVDPLLGTTAEWDAFVAEAHERGIKVILDFNPSYWWTGSPTFKQAEAHVRTFGASRSRQPAGSPARWFRWRSSCGSSPLQKPPDDWDDLNDFTMDWVYSPDAEACYYAVWGGTGTPRYGGQPTADLASPEWRAELTNILTHWVTNRGADGFLIDAPPELLSAPGNAPNFDMSHALVASYIRDVIVDPVHALGAAVFGEIYNLQVPPIAKQFDGGRNTDMGGHGNPVVEGFPSLVHDMVVAQDARGLEPLLQRTVDVYTRWGIVPRTQPHSGGGRSLKGIKAAATALLGGYYYIRFGPDCSSPYETGYGASPAGNEWPGGCFGDWSAAPALASTLIAMRSSPALRPGTPRTKLALSGEAATRAYAALRMSEGTGALVLLNFANSQSVQVTLSAAALAASSIRTPQTPVDLIDGGDGPPMNGGSWRVTLPTRGWKVYGVVLGGR
uniref:Glycosyl hydrolase family 13 catalytic domain-containing protein n=2 Tax=Emiliania huxleyi TaxID=2903 RepID=A0A7S3TL01_EMIHU